MFLSTKFLVGISGNYGGLNLGDEAILQSIIAQLRASLPVEITVFSRNAEDTRQRHQVERIVGMHDLTRDEIGPEIERLDLLILGGGGILFNDFADILLRELEIAHQKDVYTMVYAVGVGPLTKLSSKERVKQVLNKVDIITVREREAKKTLEEIGLECPVVVTADPALLLTPEPFPEEAMIREQMQGKQRLIGISVREAGPAAPDIDPAFYHNLLANVADFVISRFNAEVVFVPMEQSDVQHSHAIIAQMLRPKQAWVLNGEYRSGQVYGLMSHFEFVIGMRLHFLIFAALAGVPFVALPYASKVNGFLEDMQMPMPQLNKVNAGIVTALIDKAWDERNATKEKIQRVLPELKRRAAENNRFAISLLEHKSVIPVSAGQ